MDSVHQVSAITKKYLFFDSIKIYQSKVHYCNHVIVKLGFDFEYMRMALLLEKIGLFSVSLLNCYDLNHMMVYNCIIVNFDSLLKVISCDVRRAIETKTDLNCYTKS